MREKTVTRSFRISERTFIALEEEANKRKISLNALVNQIFLSYTNFDRYFQRLGMLKMTKVTFMKILKDSSDKEIIELAREVSQNSSKVIILSRYGILSLKNILEYINDLADYGYFVERSEVVSPDEKRVITLIHNYGERGSFFLKSYVIDLFKQINIMPKLSSTDNSVSIEI